MKSKNNLLVLISTILVFSLTAQPPSPQYKLVFSDDFDGISIDANAWWKNGDNGGCNTHGQGECEEDMWYKPENVTQNGGNLILTAKNDLTICEGNSKNYSSGWVHTAADFKYGYYEIRAKVPENNGFWPAFWFWSGNNNLSYQEIDVFEFCGCDCGEYSAGFFYETDDNGIAGDNSRQASSKIETTNDACQNFNIYGVEWTPSHINFYLNGTMKSTYSNINNHMPMGIILNLAVGGCFGGCGWTYCGDLGWNTLSNCQVVCGTTFPKSFLIDWIKGYQKENHAIYINGINELCVGETFTFKAPNYPNAIYEWTGTSGLQINPSPWLNFDGGIWRTADVTAISSGLQTLTLTVTFPSGYVESKTYNISIQNDLPATPVDIIFDANDINCCWDFYTPVVSSATSYYWNINTYNTYSTPTNYPYDCVTWGNVTISVAAHNSCGTSPMYSETIYLPPIDCRDIPQSLVVFPNPSSSLITLKFLDNENNEITEITGNVFLINQNGSTVLQKIIENNMTEINIQNIQNGQYQVIFQNDDFNLSTTFMKND